MIVSGTRDAVLDGVQPVSIHGTILYDLAYTHLGEGQQRRARLGAESVYADPRPGDAVRVSYLMNVATAVERRG
ncbi:MAG: hypothetical protein HGA45_13225 [Chloroflexales bacterium]|nr:hypothetical protein [Chloroflexales bacterium]